MLQKTALMECSKASARLTLPNTSGPLLVGEVGDALAVLDAVARVVEPRLGRVPARLERGGRGDDLERRARDEQALRRPVEERRRPAGTGPASAGPDGSRSRRGSGRTSVRMPSRARHLFSGRARRRLRTRSRNCSVATRCASGCSVSTRSFPTGSSPRSLSTRSVDDGAEVASSSRSGSRSCDSSSPARARSTVE